jgi:hypothetical protein
MEPADVKRQEVSGTPEMAELQHIAHACACLVLPVPVRSSSPLEPSIEQGLVPEQRSKQITDGEQKRLQESHNIRDSLVILHPTTRATPGSAVCRFWGSCSVTINRDESSF